MTLKLKLKPTLGDFQSYVKKLVLERGFDKEPITQTCLHLGEEVGELFKAIRKTEKMKVDKNSESFNIDEELADIFIFLCKIANKYSIDLEKAFRKKEGVNKKRTWK